jgi:hypothetical protein
MSMKTNWRAAGLGLSMVALLLLAACTSAVSTEQVSETLSTVTPTDPEETIPTDTPAPTDPATTTSTDTATPTVTNPGPDPEYEIVTLLPRDAIPAIDDPRFYGVSEADQEYDPKEFVLGVELDGEARAYSISLLSQHEIVNDTVAGRPIAVTW